MGGSSFKKIFFWKKKKKSPLKRAMNHLKGALPNKKRRQLKKQLDKLSVDKRRREKHSKKRFSLTTDKKAPISLKRLSLGNIRKESIQNASLEGKEKDKGGLERVGEQIKRKFSQEHKRGLGTQPEPVPPSLNLRDENEGKVSKKKFSDIMRSLRPTGSKTSGQRP